MKGAQVLLCFTLLSVVLANHVNRARIHNLVHNSRDVEEVSNDLYFNQILDHFVPSSQQEFFQQRYYVNQSHWNQTSSGPAFLIIGGESALRNTSVTRGAVVEMAAQYGAILFALEHRFYGMSSPFDSLNSTTLPYLNTQQALSDLVNFRESMVQQYNLSQNTKWVVFGCSYPGALSAWFRAKFPNVAVASLSVSSPVEAVLDFYQYDQYVANSIGPQCADPIRNATLQLQALLMNNATNTQIRERLSCSAVEDPVAVLYVLADTVAYVVQYNYHYQQMCANFTNSTNLVDTYVDFVNYLFSELQQDCLSFDISSFTNETYDPSDMLRQWMWQSCDELGYFQTAPANNSLRSPLITAEWHLTNVCQKLFNNATNGPRIAWTNSFYGGNNSISTSNTIFANGLLDPWQALSVTRSLSASVPAILIANEAHCSNWYASSVNDSQALKDARAQISSYIGAFLDSCGPGCGEGVCSFTKKGNDVAAKCAYFPGETPHDGSSGSGVPWWSLLVLALGLVVIGAIVVYLAIRSTKARFYSRV